jgi:hypothetical protein
MNIQEEASQQTKWVIVQLREHIYLIVMDWLGIDVDSSDDADKLSLFLVPRGSSAAVTIR